MPCARRKIDAVTWQCLRCDVIWNHSFKNFLPCEGQVIASAPSEEEVHLEAVS